MVEGRVLDCRIRLVISAVFYESRSSISFFTFMAIFLYFFKYILISYYDIIEKDKKRDTKRIDDLSRFYFTQYGYAKLM